MRFDEYKTIQGLNEMVDRYKAHVVTLREIARLTERMQDLWLSIMASKNIYELDVRLEEFQSCAIQRFHLQHPPPSPSEGEKK